MNTNSPRRKRLDYKLERLTATANKAFESVDDTMLAARLHLLRMELEQATDLLATSLLEEGKSYGEVGHLLNMTRQAAHKRYAHVVQLPADKYPI